MPERDDKSQDNFVMSGNYAAAEERDEAPFHGASAADPNRKVFKPVLVAGIVLLVAVVVLLMFLSGSPRSGDREQLKNLESRLKQLEEKIGKLDWIDTGMARIDRREKEIAGLSERLAQTEAALNRRIDQIAREAIKPAAPSPAPAPARAETPPPSKPEAAAPAAAKPAAPQTSAKTPAAPPAPTPTKNVKESGKIHVVQPGETLYGVARKYNLPIEQLLKLNNLTTRDTLKTGQKLIVGN